MNGFTWQIRLFLVVFCELGEGEVYPMHVSGSGLGSSNKCAWRNERRIACGWENIADDDCKRLGRTWSWSWSSHFIGDSDGYARTLLCNVIVVYFAQVVACFLKPPKEDNMMPWPRRVPRNITATDMTDRVFRLIATLLSVYLSVGIALRRTTLFVVLTTWRMELLIW